MGKKKQRAKREKIEKGYSTGHIAQCDPWAKFGVLVRRLFFLQCPCLKALMNEKGKKRKKKVSPVILPLEDEVEQIYIILYITTIIP